MHRDQQTHHDKFGRAIDRHPHVERSHGTIETAARSHDALTSSSSIELAASTGNHHGKPEIAVGLLSKLDTKTSLRATDFWLTW